MRFRNLAISIITISAFADSFPVIIRGKVTMPDGSAPTKRVAIERVCSDGLGSAPGPLVDDKGDFVWRMDVDPFLTRTCFLRVATKEYTSTTVDISSLNGVEKNVTLPAIIMREHVADPYTITTGGFGIPGKAKDNFNAGIKAIDAGNIPEATAKLRAAVTDVPKFPQAWMMLGILEDTLGNTQPAREAYQKTIEQEPKTVAAYVTLAKACVRLKDYACATQAADAYLKADNKRTYADIYVHQAVARFMTKDLPGAESAANDAIKAKAYRAEYVLARIAADKGDVASAKDHLNKYLQAEPTSPIADQLKTWGTALGKPEAASLAPDFY